MSREIRKRKSDFCEPVDAPIWFVELQDPLGQKNKPDGETDEDGVARCMGGGDRGISYGSLFRINLALLTAMTLMHTKKSGINGFDKTLLPLRLCVKQFFGCFTSVINVLILLYIISCFNNDAVVWHDFTKYFNHSIIFVSSAHIDNVGFVICYFDDIFFFC